MVLNIPVPITDLERKGILVAENLFIIESGEVTKNITWSGLLTRITKLPDTLIFGFGSVELPAVCFVDSFSGFYAPQLGSIGISTGHTEKFVIRPSGLIEFGDPLLKETSLTTIKSEARIKCNVRLLENVKIVEGFNVYGNVQLNGEIVLEDINISGEGNGSNLVVYGDSVKFGTNCQNNLNVYNISKIHCEVDEKESIIISQDLDNHLSAYETTITTPKLIVARQSLLNIVNINTPGDASGLIVDDGGRVEFSKNGDIIVNNISNIPSNGGVNVGGVIFGDGQGITNLDLPSSLRLKGSIDPTTQGPGTPQHGDLWYSSADGNFNNQWLNLSGDPVTIGKYIYYFATPTPRWALGAISDLQSPFFMKIDLTQTITGNKIFEDLLVAQEKVDTTDIVAGNLKLIDKGQSALTIAGDNNKIITTKSYVDARMSNSILDNTFKTSKYIIGQNYDGSSPRLWSVETSPTGVDNLVLRTTEGNFSANIITATFLDGIATDTKTLDIFQSESNSEHPVTLVRSTGLSRQVYSDSDFTYNPVTDTLSVDFIIGEVTGDVTGNISTATKFETARTLWGQSFDGTSNVSGDVIDAGNITPQENNTKDIGADDNVFSDVYSDKFHGTLLGDVTVGDSTREDLIDGDHILGGLWNGSVPVTWAVEGTPDFSFGKIVVRDNLGDFSSNRIVANQFIGSLTGDVTGNINGSSGSVTGNTNTATKFETSRLLWTQSFDGTSNVSSAILNVNDIVPSEGSKYDIGTPSFPFSTLYVDEIFGDVDNNATSTDKLGHALGRGDYIEGSLNQWDGSVEDTWSLDPRSSNDPNKIVVRNSDNNFSAGTITASFVGNILGGVIGDITGSSGFVTGNAETATKFETSRLLWGNSFDGTQSISSDISSTGDIIPSADNEYTLGEVGLRFKAVYANTFHGNIKDNVENANRLENYLNNGNYIIEEPWNGSKEITWSVFSKSGNIGDSVVNRDSTGSFRANVVSSNLIGDFIGNVTGNLSGSSNSVTGNAASCTRLVTERKVDVKITGALIGQGTLGYLGGDNMELIAPIEVTMRNKDIRNLEPLPE